MPSENNIWHARVELYNSSFQYVKLKRSKRKPLFNHDSAKYLLDIIFIMCLHRFQFLLELSIFVSCFVVGTIDASFKYAGNTNLLKIYISFFFPLLFTTYLEHVYFIKLLPCGDIETIIRPFNWRNSISFYHWNLNSLLARNCKSFH